MDEFLADETQKPGDYDLGEGGGGRGESEAENVEINLLENDIGNKRAKEMAMDRLSALPDCLLIHVLSFLGMKGAAITSVLGKRWKDLWTELPTLEFWIWDTIYYKSNRECDFVAWVHKTLATRSWKCLEKLVIGFNYKKCFASDVDNWLVVALKYKVKHIHLDLSPGPSFLFHPLHEMMCSSSSLTSLALQGCVFVRELEIKWNSLTSLEIAYMELPQPVLEKILSGCPVLERLDLYECWGFTRLEIVSKNLHNLSFDQSSKKTSDDFFQISAPYLKSLEMWLWASRTKLRLSNISSLASASVLFYESFDQSVEHVVSNAKEFFKSIQHVKELELDRNPIKALRALLLDGWLLPMSTRRCLTIRIFRNDAESIPGILGLLDSSPGLETLVIKCHDYYNKDDETWVAPARWDLGRDLEHLKTVKLDDLDLGCEPMLIFVGILLKRAPSLKEMSIEDSMKYHKISQTLLTFPRASPDAVFFFR